MSEIDNLLSFNNQSSELICPIFTNETKYINEQLSFWVGGVMVCFVTCTGFLLNLITIYILYNDSTLKNVFNLLFITLIINDNISLLLMTFETFSTNLGLHSWIHDIVYPYFTLPFISISLTAAIFLTIIIAHERYMATKYPISHRQSLISAFKRRKLFLKYILFVMISTIIINIPKFLEAELKWKCINYGNQTLFLKQTNSSEYNETLGFDYSAINLFSDIDDICEVWKPLVRPTRLRMNSYYITYYIVLTRLLFLGIFPFALLAFLNYRIYHEIQVPSIITALPELERDNRRKQENDLAKVLIGIVVIFILCNFLRVLLDFYEMVNIETIIACNRIGRMGTSSWVIQLNYFSKLMMATDASISMVIYCLINKNFRKKLFWWKRLESITTRQT